MVASFSLYHSSSSISKNPLSVLLLAHAERYKAEHKVYTSFLDKDLSCTHTHTYLRRLLVCQNHLSSEN